MPAGARREGQPNEPSNDPSAEPSNDELMLRVQVDPPGVHEFAGRPSPVVVVHIGPSVHIACQRDGQRHAGLSVHGDVDIVPAGVASKWELRQRDTALIIGLPERLLRIAADEMDLAGRPTLLNRFQMRDPRIEHLGWALKSEMEAGYPNGNLYLDSLATALSLHLLHHHSSSARKTSQAPGGLTGHRLKQIISYIEDNLARNLSIEEIAGVAGLSVSHCKAAFRNSVGQPIHRYVIGRRVERAMVLLREGKSRGGDLSISQVALETGFAHQSHLAYHLRRVLGVSPKSLQSGQSSE